MLPKTSLPKGPPATAPSPPPPPLPRSQAHPVPCLPFLRHLSHMLTGCMGSSHNGLFRFFKSLFGGGQRERERERIPSRIRAVSTEPDVGLKPTNREILT